ncbi:hypothetical protein BDZ45DRAFT_376949 [Acephala macrosclerotiorum]|nr:hypothetical protein BDZ45DRAFT_376949 [Acephala macrosclerotiorum]
MAPASPSQTATISESARPSHTPNSERSWRHWPSLHSSNHKSPVTSSEGRPGFWGGLRLKGRINGHSADDNGSPTNRERRKSITDIFADLGSPKKQRERSWSIGRLHTKSGSASSSKNDSRIERLIQPKRRRSISDLFGSLRAHSSNHVSPQVQTPSILPEFSGRGDDLTVNTGHANKEDTGGKPSVVETATVVRVPPTLRVRFANSDQCEDRLENRSERTIIIRDIKQPEAERRICSASSGTSNSPTLVAEDRQDVNLQPGKETDRPRTPDSYLQMLIAAYESPASGSSMSHEHNSPSPSPGKYQAVQPLDFLADKYTPPMDDRDW